MQRRRFRRSPQAFPPPLSPLLFVLGTALLPGRGGWQAESKTMTGWVDEVELIIEQQPVPALCDKFDKDNFGALSKAETKDLTFKVLDKCGELPDNLDMDNEFENLFESVT